MLHRSDAEVRRRAPDAELGADRVRLTAGWSALAPGAAVATKPAAPFDATDTRDLSAGGPARARPGLTAVNAEGLEVQIDLAFWAPRWAVRAAAAAPRQRYFPNAKDFGDFATAIARRYTGHFTDPRHGIGWLPPVHLYTTWNEPNNRVVPDAAVGAQARRATGRSRRTSTARCTSRPTRRSRASTRTTSVLIGGLTRSAARAREAAASPPLAFLRTMACVNRALRPLRVPECDGAGMLHADGFAHAPVLDARRARRPRATPRRHLSRRPRVPPAAAAARRAGPHRLDWPLYITEYGYETQPPDPTAHFSPAQQARISAGRRSWPRATRT